MAIGLHCSVNTVRSPIAWPLVRLHGSPEHGVMSLPEGPWLPVKVKRWTDGGTSSDLPVLWDAWHGFNTGFCPFQSWVQRGGIPCQDSTQPALLDRRWALLDLQTGYKGWSLQEAGPRLFPPWYWRVANTLQRIPFSGCFCLLGFFFF